MSEIKENYELPRINETNFVKNYLPLLLLAKTADDRQKWIDDVSKVPSLRVEVVADDDHEKVLYWVPPVTYTVETVVGSNLGSHLQRGIEHTAIRQNKAHIENAVMDLKELAQQAEPPEEDVAQWQMILDRYGILEALGKKPDGKTTNGDSGKLDYEEDGW